MQLSQGNIILPGGRDFSPFQVTVRLQILDGANTETVTPTAVSNCNSVAATSSTPCTITASFTNAHGAGAYVRSGSGGLDEAIWDVGPASGNTGGVVMVDSGWGGTNTIIAAAIPYHMVSIEDVRSGPSSTGARYRAPLVVRWLCRRR
jgi:hypothetical protein